MAQSLSQLYIHLIFHVKETNIKRDHLGELWHYIAGVARAENSVVLKVGGEPDHVHILCTLPRNTSLAQFVEEVKRVSSKWMKEKDSYYRQFFWQRGYAAFSVSQSKVAAVERYIDGQREHHRTKTFQEEYIEWLQEYGISYDENYVFSD